MKKTKIVIFLLIIGLLLVPYDSFAISEKKEGVVEEESATRDSESPQYSAAGAANACMNDYLQMKITVGKYNRNASYDGTTYTNTVSPRKITFTNNTGKSYKIVIYHGPIGSLDDLKNLSDKEIEKYNDAADDVDDGDESEEDNTIAVKKKTMKKDNKSWSWELPVGEEALVIYLNGSKKKSNYVYSGACANKDKDGNCIAWKQLRIYCTKGKLDAKKSTAEEPVLSGNALSVFVENPYVNGKVPNIKKSEPSCENARSGIYDGNETEQELYNVKPEHKETWTNYYYDKLLKNFCTDGYVDFNLTDKNIKELTNGLLKVFYYNNNIDELKKQGKLKDLETISRTAEEWRYWIENKYRSLGLSSDGHIFEGNNVDLTTSLQCRYDKQSFINSDGKSLEDDYLYITKEKTEKADITKTNVGSERKTKSIDVCSTKCYEHLTVKYDIPKTVKAGLCFSYKVTVKSESECGIEVKDYWDELKKPDTCAPVAICENDEKHTQAGPNEDFDSCISECDDGKYSQVCINSCYEKVYKDKKTNTKKTSNNTKKYKVNNLINRVFDIDSSKLERLAQKYEEEQLTGYYDSDKVISKCKTTKKIEDNLDDCAEYFFEAKALYPKGKYKCFNSSCSVVDKRGGGNLKWVSDNSSDTSGIVKSPIDTKGTFIPEQIGRAAPFYLRDVPATRELLIDLIGRYKDNGRWYKYVINGEGFKQNYSERWVCHEKCSFTGCGEGNDLNIAYTSRQYSKNLVDDLDRIQEALSNCNASTSCDTKERTTEFEINIKTNGVSGTGGSTGTTTVESTDGDAYFNGGDKTDSMFTPENIDEFGNSTDPSTQTGILGLCYDNRTNPHYQTTITYPGTYINYKTGARKYVNTIEDTYYFKNKYFCTPYDDKDVNKDYAYWAIINKYNLDSYPSNFKPDTYNIEAQLGKQGKGFGMYNWKVHFDCFYGSLTDLVTVCTPGVDCPNPPTCQPTDPNYPICSPPITTKCSNGECDECSSAGSGRMCNVNFRVVDSTNLFPDPTKASGKKDEKDVAFNWTSKAQDMDTSTTYGQALQSRGYMINPTEYRHSIEDTAGNNSEYYYGGIPMYHIKLTRENIRDLKGYVKDHGYNTYGGTYTKVENTEMRYYNISNDVKGYIDYFDNSNAHLGYNNK